MNRSIPVRLLAMSLAAALTAWSGCGPGHGLNLAKVSGKVMYKGQPVKNGTVFFMPDEAKGTVGPPAVGSITSDGSYVMSTDTAGDGVIVGHHKVGITGVEPVSASSQEEYDPEKDAGGYMKAKSKEAAQARRAPPRRTRSSSPTRGARNTATSSRRNTRCRTNPASSSRSKGRGPSTSTSTSPATSASINDGPSVRTAVVAHPLGLSTHSASPYDSRKVPGVFQAPRGS